MGSPKGSGARRKRAFAVALLTLAGLLTIAISASAAPSTLWQRCDGGEDDIACGAVLRGVATAPVTAPAPGEVLVADQSNVAVREFTPWGDFVKSWGWDVVASGPGDKGTGFEICVPANGDVCKAGVAGVGAGAFSTSNGGVAVDSVGNVYVVDKNNLRVQKFSPAGEFLRMWGKGVNSGTSGNPDICTNAGPPTDVCGAGSAGTGPGQFSSLPVGSYLTVFTNNTSSESDDKVGVGDKARIQIFNTSGEFQSQITAGIAAAEQVQGLAVDVNGNLYATIDTKANVRKWNPVGISLGETIKVTAPRALATDGARNVYVIDVSSAAVIRKFGPNGNPQPEQESWGQEEPPTPKLADSTGIAAGSACFNVPTKEADVYVSNVNPTFLRAYGPAPNNLALCPKPPKPPNIVAQYPISVGTIDATLQAKINPRFWADTKYFVQYATAACIEGGGWEAACVKEKPPAPGTLLGAGESSIPANTKGIILTELEASTAYRFRFAAQSEGGGPVFGVGGTPGEDGAEGAFGTLSAPATPADTCFNAAFRTGPGAFLADCRAYEMVSPVDKAGGDIVISSTSIGRPAGLYQGSTSGDGLAYSSRRAFGDPESAPGTSQYIARRDVSAGWASEAISPPLGLPTGKVTGESEYKAFSADLCDGWVVPKESTAPALAPGAMEGLSNLYRRESCGVGAGLYEARGAGSLKATAESLELQGLSVDGEAIFRAEDHLAQDAAIAVGFTQLRCQSATKAKTIAFQWLRNGAPIPAADKVEYQPVAEDEGKAVQCRVTGTNDNAGATQIANPAWVIAPYPATAPPEAPRDIPAPSANAPLTVGGPGGQTLSCDPNAAGWQGSPTFKYQWHRNGVALAGNGADTATYTVQAADLASAAAFQCEVLGENPGGAVAKVSANLLTSPAPSGPAAPVARAGSQIASEPGSVYYSEEEGELHTVCVLPGGKTASHGCTAGTAQSSFFDGRSQSVDNAFSRDGSRVFWTDAYNNLGRLYLRLNPGEEQSALDLGGECTEAAKACTIAVSAGAAQFWTAATDGSVAIFSEGTDLYEFDVPTRTATLIAKKAKGVLGASEDAKRTYLVSEEVLSGEEKNSEGDKAQAGKANLYLHEAGGGGSNVFASTLSSVDATAVTESRPTPVNIAPFNHAARVSPDGDVAAFISTASLTGYDNSDAASGEADTEVFRYEAATKQLDCVSCNPSGARPAGKLISRDNNSKFWAAAKIPGAQTQTYFSRALSDDGERLFFESFDPLVLRDTNGKLDVYQWEAVGKGGCGEASGAFSAPAGGCVSLISTGEDSHDAEFLDASPSGDDVFFRTGQSLVSSDPGVFDVYDARVGGGFPQPTSEPPCEGDACQSQPIQPQALTPASEAFQGQGNPSPRKRCAKGKRRVVKGGKARCVKRKGKGKGGKGQRRARQDGRSGR